MSGGGSKFFPESFFRLSPNLLCIVDESGAFIEVNNAWTARFGTSSNQLNGKSLFSFGFKSQVEITAAEIKKKIDDGESNFVFGLTLFDAHENPQHLHCNCIIDVSMRIILVVLQDVTQAQLERNHIEATKAKLEDREEFFESTLSALPCLVSFIGTDLTYKYVNAEHERWFRKGGDSYIGKSVRSVIGEIAFLRAENEMARAMNGEEIIIERTGIYPGVGHKTLLIHYLPSRDRQGVSQGIYIVAQDLTAQTRAKKDLTQREAEISRLLNSVSMQISHWDSNLRCVYMNRAFADFFGLKDGPTKGQHLRELLGDAAFEEYRPRYEAALRGEYLYYETCLILPENKQIDILVNQIPDIVDGEVKGFFVVASDTTELKLLEKERREIESKLVAASKMSSLGEMAGGIAHEINNPLAIIGGKALQLKEAVLEDRYEPEIFLSHLSRIEITIERIAKIIRGLRSFARNSEKDPRLDVSLNQIIQETVDLCSERMKAIGIEFKMTELAPTLVHCRGPQISQIVMNLLGNSIDAIQFLEKRWISIEVESVEGKVRIGVVDSGQGLDPVLAEKIMQPFFTTKEIGKGTGLGLSISKGLAEENGGSLYYDRSCANTRFVLEVPLASTTPNSTPQANSKAA